MIKVNLTKKLKAYNGMQSLRINKQFTQGSITRVTGPSGAGKTTFLKMLAGLIVPDEGSIKVGDAVWFDAATKVNLTPQARLTGFVFQDYALFPNMTVEQHLLYANDDTAWTTPLLALGRMEAFSKQKPVSLSGGQQQRLAILRALAIKPKVLLMDEPFSALDMKMKTGLITELKAVLSQIGATTIIVSHNPHELDGIADDELVIGEQ